MSIRKKIDLLINADNLSAKPLAEVSKQIDDLSSALDSQSAKAKKGEVSIKELTSQINQLKDAQKALRSQGSMLDNMERLNRVLADHVTRLAEAKTALETLKNSNTATSKQIKQAENRVSSATSKVDLFEDKIRELSAAMSKLGIDSNNAAASEAKIEMSAQQSAEAIKKLQSVIDNYDKNLRETIESEKRETEALNRKNKVLAEAKAAYDRVKAARAAERQAGREQREVTADPNRALSASEAKLQQLLQQRIAIVERLRNAVRRSNEGSAERTTKELAAIDQLILSERRLIQTRQEVVNSQNKVAAANAKVLADFRALAAASETFAASLRRVREAAQSSATNKFSDSIRSIIDPTHNALNTLGKLDTKIREVGAILARALGGPVENYKKHIADLKQAQQRLVNQSDLITSFNNQVTALANTRQAYIKARDDVKSLADQIARSTTPNHQLAESLRSAQSALAASASAYQKQSRSLIDMRSALRQAGVDTANLGNEQRRIQSLASQTVAQINRLSATNRGLSESSRNAAGGVRELTRSISLLGGERQSLSFLQRLRGEVLSVTASMIGLYGAFDQFRKMVDLTKQTQGATALFTSVYDGDKKKAAEELKYVAEQAYRLGMNLQVAIKQYGKYMIAAKAAGLTQQATRFTFEKLGEAAMALSLTPEKTTQLINAFEQMLSKGQITAEEMKGQAAEALAGVMAGAAEGMGLTIEEYIAAMSRGELKIREAFVASVRGASAQYSEAFKSAQAQIALRENQALMAIDEFRMKIMTAPSDTGETVESKYLELLKALTRELQSGEADNLARALAAALRTVLEVLRLIIENMDLLIAAFKAMLFLKLVMFVKNLYLAFQMLATGVAATSGAVTALAGTVSRLIGLLKNPIAMVITVTIVGWELLEKFNEQANLANVTATEKQLQSIQSIIDKAEAEKAKIEKSYKDFAKDTGNIAPYTKEDIKQLEKLNKIIKEQNALLDKRKDAGYRYQGALKQQQEKEEEGKLKTPLSVNPDDIKATEDPGTKGMLAKDPAKSAKAAEALQRRMDSVAAGLLRKESALNTSMLEAIDQANEAIDTKFKSWYDDIDKLAEGDRKVQKDRLDAIVKGAKELEAVRIKSQFEKKEEKQERKESGEAETIRNQLESMRAAALNAQARLDDDLIEGLETRKRAIDEQFADIERKVKGTSFQPEFDEAKAMLYKSAENKFNEERLKAEKDISDKILAVEIKHGKNSQDELELRMQAIRDSYAELYADIAKQAQYNAPKSKIDIQRVDKAVVDEQAQARLDYFRDEAAKKEQKVNDMVSARNDQIQAQQTLMEAGLIGEYEGQQNINKILSQNSDAITSQAESTITWAESMRGTLDDGTLDAIISRMKLVQADANKFQEGLIINTQNIRAFASGLTSSVSDTIGEIAKATQGTQSWAEAFKNIKQSFKQFAADFLKRIGEMILQSLILQAIMSALGVSAAPPAAGAANPAPIANSSTAAASNVGLPQSSPAMSSTFGGAGFRSKPGVMHTGGLVGGNNVQRSVPPTAFVGAPRFHTGGIAGKSSDEYLTILQKNEEVLTTGDPRHVFNSDSKSTTNNQPVMQDIKVVNAIDSASFVSEGLSTSDGTKTLLNVIKSNRSTINQLLGR